MTFGELLRKERLAAQRTLREVAAWLGLSVPYLSDVEKGRRLPLRVEHVRKLAPFLGIEPDALVMAASVERSLVCPHCGKAIQ